MDANPAALLEQLREKMRGRPPTPIRLDAERTPAEKAADAVAAIVGSWRFILTQSALLIAWIVWNAAGGRPFDPFPFILLNLVLSFQAAYTAPIIMMSQNRQADIDRERAIEDFDINTKAELEIELLHEKIDLLKEQEIARLADALDRLTKLLEAKGA
jgi:uncharacterized membrane protein